VVVDPPDEDPPEETATSDELLGLTVMVLIGLVLLVALCGVAYAVKKKRSTVQAVAKYNMAK
jgi:hypothetical protein